MFKHRGGNFPVWDDKGNKVDTIYYGPGLQKACPECKVGPSVRCVTASGKLLGKNHSSRV